MNFVMVSVSVSKNGSGRYISHFDPKKKEKRKGMKEYGRMASELWKAQLEGHVLGG